MLSHRTAIIALAFATLFLHPLSSRAASPAPASPPTIDALVETFTREPQFDDLDLSPTGEYLAATVPQGDKTVLVVLRLSDMKPTAAFRMRGRTHVTTFAWASPTRLVLAIGERFGTLEAPSPTGEVYYLDAETGSAGILAGPRAAGDQTGTRIKPKDDGQTFAFIIDALANDDDYVLVSTSPMYASAEAYTRAERLDIRSGRRDVVAKAPVRRADFLADHAGRVRFATGANSDNIDVTFYRTDDDAPWVRLHDEAESGTTVWPFGFSADNTTAYLWVSREQGPDAVEAMVLATGERKEVFRDPVGDPHSILFDRATGAPIGIRLMDGLPRSVYFDPESPASRTRRSLEAAFPGQMVDLRGASRDGKKLLLVVRSDRNPGEFFLYDAEAKTAARIGGSRDWLDPETMASTTPVRLKARDGLDLHGYLTVPKGREAKGLPLVVLPHGGPFDIRDDWGFDAEVQLLAARGYGVLQVNFRGSGGRGADFVRAGYRQWGRAMQDDLTDATRWAIDQGIADKERLCMVGASYGAYAALMGAVKEPALYRCVAGVVGVYDLEVMYRRGDVQDRLSGENYLRETLGTEGLAEVSPNRHAAAIQVPVLLSAGAEDERAPAVHTEMMAKALKDAGKTVDVAIYPGEGHGFENPENRADHYRRLLRFLDTHLAPTAPR